MLVYDNVAQAYIADEDIENTGIEIPMQMHLPVLRRVEVIQKLTDIIHKTAQQFPIFNYTLWHKLFSNDMLEHICIVLVLGTGQHRIIQKDDMYIIYFDLFLVADATRVIASMQYLIQNYLTYEITRICLHQKYQLTSKQPFDILDYTCFVHGLANFLAWGEDAQMYKLHTNKYEDKKANAFALLSQAIEIQDKSALYKILTYLQHASFWNNFTSVAGMFYFNDVYRDEGVEGLQKLKDMGTKHFIQHIFER